MFYIARTLYKITLTLQGRFWLSLILLKPTLSKFNSLGLMAVLSCIIAQGLAVNFWG